MGRCLSHTGRGSMREKNSICRRYKKLFKDCTLLNINVSFHEMYFFFFYVFQFTC